MSELIEDLEDLIEHVSSDICLAFIKRNAATIDERDLAEEALSQAYYLVIGRSPEWSSAFGHADALVEIEDACVLLRATAARALKAEALLEEREDKIEGLTADLFEAVSVAYNRGAAEWTFLNYRTWVDRIEANSRAAAEKDAQP